uniref:Putative mam domain protein n=1 Tax=Ixodes ricinus TaxID=34613 RepID=A0A147BHX5_IXORI
MDCTLVVALVVVGALGSGPVVHGLFGFKFRPAAERAIDSGDHAKAHRGRSSSSGDLYECMQRVESIDFQSDQVNARHNDTHVDSPVISEALGLAKDQTDLEKSPEHADARVANLPTGNASLHEAGVAERSGASLPGKESRSGAIIAHHTYIPWSTASPANIIGSPSNGKTPFLPHQVPMPALGPFPPNYVSFEPVPRLTKPDVMLFSCTFENHNCGMRNQKNIGRHFNPEKNGLQNRQGRYMVVHAENVGYNVSRLITPYLPGYLNATACLSISYIVYGEGADRLEIVAQDTVNRHLFRLDKDGPGWRHFASPMAAHQDVRFFIEAYTTSRAKGVIAIDNFQFGFGPC